MNTPNLKTTDPKETILHRIRFYAARSRPCIPDLATIQFLKARIHPRHQLHYVTFHDTTGMQWIFIYFLNQHEDGSWYISTSGGSPGHSMVQSPNTPDRPWLDLRGGQGMNQGSQGTSYEFYAGGEVIDNGFGIVRVRLIGPSEHVLEDAVQDGLVLFWSDQYVGIPLQAQLYNSANELVCSQTTLSMP